MEYYNLKSVLDEFVQDVILNYKSLLEIDGRRASGKLIDTIDYKVEEIADGFEVYLILQDYWEEIENGRQPTKNGGNGEVKVKIAKWIQDKGIRTGDGKDLPTPNQLAYLISRKIHTYGYSGGGYLQKTLDSVIPLYDERLQDALLEDTYASINEEVVETINNIKF